MKMELTADYLEAAIAANPGLDLGQVFINEMPRECGHGVLLMDTYGGTPIDPYIPGMRHAGLRAVLRSVSYKRGYLAAMGLEKVLTNHVSTSVSGRYIQELFGPDAAISLRRIIAMNEPKPYRSSDGGYVEFELDVELLYIAPGA